MPNEPKARLIAALLFVVGASNVYAGVTGFSSRSVAQAVLAVLAALGGAGCLVCAVAAWQRRLFAWRLGFGLIVWGGVYFVLSQFFARQHDDDWASPPWPIWVDALGSFIVAAFLARFWNQQKELFDAE